MHLDDGKISLLEAVVEAQNRPVRIVSHMSNINVKNRVYIQVL